MKTIVLFNKPYGVLTQFTGTPPTLADYIPIKGVYAAGRLDKDSEGLLVLTDDGKLQHQLSAPQQKLPKTYWVQVENIPTDAALQILRAGVHLSDGLTLPAQVERMAEPSIWPRNPPIRHRAHIPTCWLQIQLIEGRNRQVRRMTAAIGHPTLRLIRYALGVWTIEGLAPGHWRRVQ